MAKRILARTHRRIAEVLAGERAVSSSPAALATVTNVTYSIADVYAQSCKTFDRATFYEVAGQPELVAPDEIMTPTQIATYCPACDPEFPDINTHVRTCALAS